MHVYLHFCFSLAFSNRFPGRIPLANSHDNTDQPKPTGPIPIIPSPIPPTPMESQNNVQQHPFPSAAYSHQANANVNSSSSLTTDYAKTGSSYSQRNPKVLPNDTGGPSLAEEILSSLRSNNKRPDGLPATML